VLRGRGRRFKSAPPPPTKRSAPAQGSFFCDESVIRECPPRAPAITSGNLVLTLDLAMTPGPLVLAPWWVIARSAGVIAGARGLAITPGPRVARAYVRAMCERERMESAIHIGVQEEDRSPTGGSALAWGQSPSYIAYTCLFLASRPRHAHTRAVPSEIPQCERQTSGTW
jgi:hypothetical protein